MSRNPVLGRLVATITTLVAVAQIACASPGDASAPQVGEVSIVFPQNDTYAVVSPFPIIFGYQNAKALLSYNSQLQWKVDCYQGALWGQDTINGYEYTEVPSGDYYILNKTETLYDVLPNDSKDPRGPYGVWLGEESPCTLTWEFFYWTTCTHEPDGSTLIQSGRGTRSGSLSFTLRPGAKLPKEAIADYQGCATKGTIEQVTNDSIACPDLLPQPEAQPCKLDVKAARSSLAAAAVSPTTSFTGTAAPTTTKPTSTKSKSGIATTSTTGSGITTTTTTEPGNAKTTSSSTAPPGTNNSNPPNEGKKNSAPATGGRYSRVVLLVAWGGTCLFNHALAMGL